MDWNASTGSPRSLLRKKTVLIGGTRGVPNDRLLEHEASPSQNSPLDQFFDPEQYLNDPKSGVEQSNFGQLCPNKGVKQPPFEAWGTQEALLEGPGLQFRSRWSVN